MPYMGHLPEILVLVMLLVILVAGAVLLVRSALAVVKPLVRDAVREEVRRALDEEHAQAQDNQR